MRVSENRFWMATMAKNTRLSRRVRRLESHFPASTVTTALKMWRGGLGSKKRSRNCGV